MLFAAALALSIPLHFEPNLGQAPASTRYIATATQYTLFLSDTGIDMRFPGTREALRMNVPRARPQAVDLLPGKSSYYFGSIPSDWRAGVPNYGRVRYRSVFPGVDLVIYGKTRQVEYDWVIAPGADPFSIRFSFSGASGIRLDSNGDLVIGTAAGEVRHRSPDIYQRYGGGTRRVGGGFVLNRGEVRFRVGPYDHSLPLIIDPQLVFAAGFGGHGVGVDFPQTHFTFADTGTGIANDRNGNVYVVGTTFSTDFPLVNATASVPSCAPGCGVRSIFIARLAPDGSSLLYSTFIGPATDLAGPSGAPFMWGGYPGLLPAGIVLDSAGNVYVTGATAGANFPFAGQATTNGGSDAFVLKLNSNGAVVASTLVGGSGDDAGASIVFGSDGFLYLAGTTQSANFPTTPLAYRTTAPTSGQNLFLAKIAPQTLKTVYCTYLAPGDSPVVGVDSSGNAYVAASTTYTGWPTTTGAVQPQCAAGPGPSCADVILLKMNPAGNQLLFATYFGGSGRDTLGGLAVDGSGSTYISGTTTSTDLATTSGAFQATWAPNPPNTYLPEAAFAAKFTPNGKLSYATYLAGSTSDQALAIAVDSAGNAYIGGMTESPDFPILNGIQETLYNYACPIYSVSGTSPRGEVYCSTAGFLSVLNTSGTGLLWSTYAGSGAVWAVTVDSAGNVYATGVSLDFTTPRLGSSSTSSVGVLKIGPQPAGLQFSPDGLTNAASFHPGLPQPGGLTSLFLHGLNVSGVVTASGFPLPIELAGVSILVRGTPSPILAVANLPSGMQQINFQVPFEVRSTDIPLVEVRYQGNSTFAVPQIVGPGIFILSDGTPAIQHASDYSLVTPSNPARKGETIVIYMTGLGPVSPAIASGAAAAGPAAAVCSPSTPAGRTLYAGLTPGFAGLYQMNVQLADNLAPGNVALYVTGYCNLPISFQFAGQNLVQSNTVTLSVQ